MSKIVHYPSPVLTLGEINNSFLRPVIAMCPCKTFVDFKVSCPGCNSKLSSNGWDEKSRYLKVVQIYAYI